ncbi:hypothetical protein BGZ61DRAFT_485895 [Ilyonectria robusta]|uniref:uncharacterized protein n=1 Tax=Ilyonectria robusta TaxID=1079257 RepID=UPI001E8E6101|nr:uncharacterized protein BGZ61DRAFT_485895 [Ilyonectria robusta]KAH8659451.1 hypothetical protein BGZ61DRAFT_485895 [Ilyonectria robusta]
MANRSFSMAESDSQNQQFLFDYLCRSLSEWQGRASRLARERDDAQYAVRMEQAKLAEAMTGWRMAQLRLTEEVNLRETGNRLVSVQRTLIDRLESELKDLNEMDGSDVALPADPQNLLPLLPASQELLSGEEHPVLGDGSTKPTKRKRGLGLEGPSKQNRFEETYSIEGANQSTG